MIQDLHDFQVLKCPHKRHKVFFLVLRKLEALDQVEKLDRVFKCQQPAIM